jgi:hypothetical protein
MLSVTVMLAGRSDRTSSLSTFADHETNGFGIALYGFGDTRAFALALLIFTALSGSWCPCGVVMTKFSDHTVTFRSSLTVVADTPMSGLSVVRVFETASSAN